MAKATTKESNPDAPVIVKIPIPVGGAVVKNATAEEIPQLIKLGHRTSLILSILSKV